MDARDELLNQLSNAVSIIKQLANIQQNLNNVRSQYQPNVPANKKAKRRSWWIIVICALIGCGILKDIGLIIGIIAGVFARKYYFKFRNEKIDAENLEIQKKEQAVLDNLANVQKVYIEQLGSWYPENYCSVDAVQYFYSAIKNFRADTLKEAINLYEISLHQKRVEDNQKQTINQQKLGNLLSAGSLLLQGVAIGEQSRHNASVEFEAKVANRTLNDIRNSF